MKLVDRDALVAKIKNEAKKCPTDFSCDRLSICKELMNSLNTLDVKELDLDEEIKKIYLKYRQYGGNKNILVILNELQFNSIAKHFFELGLKAQKGE